MKSPSEIVFDVTVGFVATVFGCFLFGVAVGVAFLGFRLVVG